VSFVIVLGRLVVHVALCMYKRGFHPRLLCLHASSGFQCNLRSQCELKLMELYLTKRKCMLFWFL
jgi:hypothetical protein